MISTTGGDGDASGPSRLSRDDQRARTRAELLAAAGRVFAKHGYHATSVDMVAEAAGFTKGAVYSNFESKEDLFLALFDAQVEATLGSMHRVMDESAPEDRAAAFAAPDLDLPVWDPEWFMLVAEFDLYAARNADVRERLSRRQRQTLEIVEAAVGRYLGDLGLEPAYPLDQLAQLIVAAGDGISLMSLNNRDTTDSGALMGILLETIAKGATRH